MSFDDTAVGLFTGDIYFPDNPRREARARELARDCQNYTANLATITANIKGGLIHLYRQMASLYGSLADIPSDARSVDMDFNGMGFEVTQIVAPLVTAPAVSAALTVGATSYLLSTGEIGAAALVDLVGLPPAFGVAVGAVAGVAAIVATFGIGAIEGAVKRDALRSTIHQGVVSRAKLAKAFLIDSQLETSIQSLISLLNALRAARVPIPEIRENLKTKVTAARLQADATTDAATAAMLAQLDGARGSWTNEDA